MHLVCIFILSLLDTSWAATLRGVHPDILHRYKPIPIENVEMRNVNPRFSQGNYTNMFQCLESKEFIPFVFVNDHYCDCKDGSDEPGTNACSNQLFYCLNKGYHSLNISSSKVDDGVCDCCDGSDEGMLIVCENICEKLQYKLNKETIELEKVRKTAVKAKMQMIKQGRLDMTNAEIRKISINNDISKTKVIIDKLHNLWNSTRSNIQVDDLQGRIKFLEKTIISITSQYNEHFNFNNTVETDEEFEDDNSRRKHSDLFDVLMRRWNQYKKHSWIKDTEAPDTIIDFISDFFYSFYSYFVSFEYLPFTIFPSRYVVQSLFSNWLSKPTKSMKNDLDYLGSKLSEMREEHKKLIARSEVDYGRHCEFYSLDNRCFSKKQDGYEYEICLYGEAKQKIGEHGDSISLGKWDKFLDSNHTRAIFTRGQYCSEFERQLELKFVCGEKNEIGQIKEPNACKYEAIFYTPILCQEKAEDFQDVEMVNFFTMLGLSDDSICDCTVKTETGDISATEHVEL